jgi:predicted nucleic acid-binding protein
MTVSCTAIPGDKEERLRITAYVQGEGWQYFQQHQDKDYSLTDCISFLVMTRFKIETAFAFDQHFVQAGFKKVP